MTFENLSRPSRSGNSPPDRVSTFRPRLNSLSTSDRLREAQKMPFKTGNIRKGRRSVFKEHGLDDDFVHLSSPTTSPISPQFGDVSYSTYNAERDFDGSTRVRLGSGPDEQGNDPSLGSNRNEDNDDEPTKNLRRLRQNSLPSRPWYAKLANPMGNRPRVKSTSGGAPGTVSGLQRFTMIALFIAVVLPALSWRSSNRAIVNINGADAGLIRPRENSPTKVCVRWAHQNALLNGTLYIYGGRAKSEGSQEDNTWNSNFLTLDLTKDWDISQPALKGLPKPDGPPKVANGYLWNDYNNLYLYGGQFSDTPYVDPGPESLWGYSIANKKWTEFIEPRTSKGNSSEPSGQRVHRAAEGAGISVPELGLSWYFGGHLGWATTPGWSRQTNRVYLKGLLEFTHPSYVNDGVDKLSNGAGAADGGVFRNITQAGVQANEFPERADGVLVFIPGWGEKGVLIGMAGGTADTFTDDLKKLDVYDIANSKWFHQETSGDAPSVRVNPCAVVASAPDASSFQIYMFGGQNLPIGSQEQYNDMYILTIPSFTWVKVNNQDGVPSKRAGHTCKMYDGQMILIGGYTGEGDHCDSPGIYVFDASSLKWKDKFTAGDHEPDFHSDNFVLAGSYGYSVPKDVQKVIGGNERGGATATTPASGPATGGPFATGKAPVFTITESGTTATVTQLTGQTGSTTGEDSTGSSSSSSDGGGSSSANPGLIAAGVIAGIAGSLAFYLGFCAWLYRRQVSAYKQHLAVSNRYTGASHNSLDPTAMLFGRRKPLSSSTQDSDQDQQQHFGWVGAEPKWLSEDPSSGYASTSGAKH